MQVERPEMDLLGVVGVTQPSLGVLKLEELVTVTTAVTGVVPDVEVVFLDCCDGHCACNVGDEVVGAEDARRTLLRFFFFSRLGFRLFLRSLLQRTIGIRSTWLWADEQRCSSLDVVFSCISL